MTLAVRQQMVVDQDHAVHLQNPQLTPGSRVEVIVLMEDKVQQVKRKPVSFLDGAQNLLTDAPPDFSTTFEESLYGHGK